MEVASDEDEAAEMIDLGMAQHQVIDPHDLARPQERAHHTLTEIRSVPEGGPAADKHPRRPRELHPRRVALPHGQKRDTPARIEVALAQPPGGVDHQPRENDAGQYFRPSRRALDRGARAGLRDARSARFYR